MTFTFPHFAAVIPEILLLSVVCIALLAYLFLGKRYPNCAYYIAQLGLLSALVVTVHHFFDPKVVTFSQLFIDDILSRLLKLFLYIATFFSFLYAERYIVARHMPRGEYYVLGLLSLLGMMVLVSAHSLMTIYLGLELLSLPLYAMVALRRDDVKAVEAAMKYFVMGAIASAMLLYGMSMLYGATGTLDLQEIARGVGNLQAEHSLLLSFALVFMLVGLGFKLAAAPFHMWAPDVYSGAPTAVTLFLSSAPKLAAVGMAIRLLVLGLPALGPAWQEIFTVMAVLSMGLGNLLAIAQNNLKRMFAYSAIAHIGYMLLGFIAGTKAGYTASLFYILTYVMMSLGAFGALVLMSRAGFEAETLADFRGLNSRNPWIALMLLFILFSMAGVPPFVGFFSKLLVLKALVATGQTWLAVLAVFFALWGAFYYIRVVKEMYFSPPAVEAPVAVAADVQVAFSVNGLVLLGLGMAPGLLIHFCQLAFAS